MIEFDYHIYQNLILFGGISLAVVGVLALIYYINCRIKKNRLETVRNAVNNLTTADFEFVILNGTGVVNYNPKDENGNRYSDLLVVDKRLVNDEYFYIITCPPITYRYGGNEKYVKFSFENVNDDSGYLKVLKINENIFNEFKKVIKDCNSFATEIFILQAKLVRDEKNNEIFQMFRRGEIEEQAERISQMRKFGTCNDPKAWNILNKTFSFERYNIPILATDNKPFDEKDYDVCVERIKKHILKELDLLIENC